MTSSLFSFTLSRPLGWVLLTLMALAHITMLGSHLALHPAGSWSLISYLGGVMTCVGVIALIRPSKLKPKPASHHPVSAAEGAATFTFILLLPLFTSLRIFQTRQPDVFSLCSDSLMASLSGVIIAACVLGRMEVRIWQRQSDNPAPVPPPACRTLTLGDAARHTAVPLVTLALWATVFWGLPPGTVSADLLFLVLFASTALGLTLGFLFNRGQIRLALGLASASILSADLALFIPSAPGILTTVAVSVVGLSAGLARRSAFSWWLAGLLLIIPPLTLLLCITAALLLIGHAP